jgi:hypothetical protein
MPYIEARAKFVDGRGGKSLEFIQVERCRQIHRMLDCHTARPIG